MEYSPVLLVHRVPQAVERHQDNITTEHTRCIECDVLVSEALGHFIPVGGVPDPPRGWNSAVFFSHKAASLRPAQPRPLLSLY